MQDFLDHGAFADMVVDHVGGVGSEGEFYTRVFVAESSVRAERVAQAKVVTSRSRAIDADVHVVACGWVGVGESMAIDYPKLP